jgi:hypothetical protein
MNINYFLSGVTSSMNINWRKDVLLIGWISGKGFEFDLNPETYPLLLRNGGYRDIGNAIMEFGKAMRDGKIERTENPAIFGPDGHRAN